jgi:two-component system, LuxR family, response regulator FixJ
MKNHTVLVVDDDPAVCDSLKFLLEVEGFCVRVYANGKRLLEEPNIRGDECLVVDEVMPGLSGLETIDAMRRRGHHNPALLMISEPRAAVRKGAAARGIKMFEKPFLQHELLLAIRNAMV